MDAREAKQRTWLLAHQLSVSYGASRSTRSTVSALANLFPGLRHFSLAVLGNDGCMVASTSKAQAGPRSVSLHLAGTSCVGLVASKGSALQANLSGPGGALLTKLSDIQAMIKDTEASSPIVYVVCMPIQPSASSSKGVKGALLLGLSSPPEFSARRTAGIAALCSMLSETLAHSSPAVICNVETMIGRHKGCACCCPDSDDELEIEDLNSDPCDDNSSGRKDRGGPPRQSLLIPIEEGEGEEEEAGCHGDSAKSSPRGKEGKENAFLNKNSSILSPVPPPPPPPPPAAPAPALPAAPMSTSCMPSATITLGGGGYNFSKPVKASITRESLHDRNPITLSYTDPALENEFKNWFQDRLKPVDFLFSMLVVASMILLAYCHPSNGGGTTNSGGNAIVSGTKNIFAVWSDMVAVPVLFPVFLALFCSSPLHQRMREAVVALVRMYLVVAASKSAVSQLHAAQQNSSKGGDAIGMVMGPATETAASFFACWIAAGGETLLTPAFGLQMRMKWHLPLQSAAIAIMCYNAQSICSPDFYTAAGFLPSQGSVNYFCTFAAAGLVGFVLPTAMLRVSEMKSRQQFEAHIAAAAGLSIIEG